MDSTMRSMARGLRAAAADELNVHYKGQVFNVYVYHNFEG